MIPSLDYEYLTWLYSQVGSVKSRRQSRSYWDLMSALHGKEFTWFVPNDDNRVIEGKRLRQEFLVERNLTASTRWLNKSCSMLELCIVLSRRLSFVADGEPRTWFWELMDNLKLIGFNDAYGVPEPLVHEVLDVVIDRNYAPNGDGGFFPLKNPDKDQRSVELWYQLNAYVIENY